MSEAPRLVVFDVDGTLIDSQDHILAAMEHGERAIGTECEGETLLADGLIEARALEFLEADGRTRAPIDPHRDPTRRRSACG